MKTTLEYFELNCNIAKHIFIILLISITAQFSHAQPSQTAVEQWNIFELSLNGPQNGNPFLDVALTGRFSHADRVIEVNGFYDGDGKYIIRFMPDALGEWSYVTKSGEKSLDNKKGTLHCKKPSPDNHGPVRVSYQYHFAYADGTPYFPIGTTAYCWELESQYEQTLKTLEKSAFNKVRFMPFPHRGNALPLKPFEGTNHEWDFYRPNPEFWRFFEKSVNDLLMLGIQADVILFHPYDRKAFGLDKMTHDQAVFYLRYVTSRIAAFRNVWWSMANEYDLIKTRSIEQWDELAQVVAVADPYGRLHSIHCLPGKRYPQWDKPWVTHISYQGYDPENIDTLIADYHKPVILDEYGYEGNIGNDWGNLSAKEEIHRFWTAVINGGYATHGDCYRPDMFFWKGGVFSGKSHVRIKFFKQEILKHTTAAKLKPLSDLCAHAGQDYYLYYFGENKLDSYTFDLPNDNQYNIDIIDTWDMKVTPVDGIGAGRREIKLPGKQYIAVRIRKITKEFYGTE